MANTFRCSIVTPSAVCLDEQATYASFQAFDGQRGVLPGSSPFLTRLAPGLLTLTTASGNKTMVIEGGFAQMQGDLLTLLADGAITIESINVKQAAEDLLKANANAVAGAGTTSQARDAAECAQQLAFAKVAAGRGNRN